jgi:CTP synthase (UTP-ammonia lyase)
MNSVIKVAIIGDYDGRPSHIATEEALKHSANKLEFELEYTWLPTPTFDSSVQELHNYDGLWGAPGSPYKSMNGALNAIQFARENHYPYLGTCGGFQHAVIEFGRNVLQTNALRDINFDPYVPNDYITALSCSLVGQTRNISIDKSWGLFNIYGRIEITEKYNCSFGLNKAFQNILTEHGLKVVGFDENDEARIMTIENHPFFIATLFQPQLSSTLESPHPLINEYLLSVNKFKASR